MDSDCKRWRLFADLINDVSLFIDLITAFCPRHYFLLIHCCSGILRALVGIAGSATRAALTQHQAKCNNMADVSAKDQSQERIVNLLALIVSLLIIPLISDQPILTWFIFLFLTLCHIYFNYRAVKSVQMKVFNLNRLAIFFENYFTNNLSNLSTSYINRMENVWFFLPNKYDQMFERVHIGQLKKMTDKNLFDHPDGKFTIYFDSKNNSFYVHLIQTSPLIIIESLWLIFSFKHFQSEKDCINIWGDIVKLIEHNNWDTSHVLLSEIIDDNEEFDNKKND